MTRRTGPAGSSSSLRVADGPASTRTKGIVPSTGSCQGLCVTLTVYDAAGGMPFFIELAHAWHLRCLADPVVGHAFSHGFHPAHSTRLASYWAQALGGPADYTALADETSVVRMHSGNGQHREMDDRACDCFDRALDDAGAVDRVRPVLVAYFRWATDRLGDYPRSADEVPSGLPFPYLVVGGTGRPARRGIVGRRLQEAGPECLLQRNPRKDAPGPVGNSTCALAVTVLAVSPLYYAASPVPTPSGPHAAAGSDPAAAADAQAGGQVSSTVAYAETIFVPGPPGRIVDTRSASGSRTVCSP